MQSNEQTFHRLVLHLFTVQALHKIEMRCDHSNFVRFEMHSNINEEDAMTSLE